MAHSARAGGGRAACRVPALRDIVRCRDMPGFSGVDVLQQLRREGLLGPALVIMITSHRSAELEAEVLERGAVDFLTKPLTAPQVLSRVQAQLRLQRIAQVSQRMPPALCGPDDASSS